MKFTIANKAAAEKWDHVFHEILIDFSNDDPCQNLLYYLGHYLKNVLWKLPVGFFANGS